MTRVNTKNKLSRLEKTAYHEAGHAIAYHFLNISFTKVTIEESKDSYGVAVRKGFSEKYDPEVNESNLKNRIIMEKDIIACMAGEAAEVLLTGRRNLVGASQDYHRAINHASYYIGNNRELEVYIKYMQIRTVNWISQPLHKLALKAVVEKLLVKKTLKVFEVRKIIKESIDKLGSGILKS